MINRRIGLSGGYVFSAASISLLLVVQTVPLKAMAFGLSSSSRTTNLSAPVYSQLDDGAGPDTHSDSATGAADGASPDGNSSDLSTIRPESPDQGKQVHQTEAAGVQPALPAQSDQSAQSDQAKTADTVAADDATAGNVQSDASNNTQTNAQANSQTNVLNATVNKSEFVPKAPVDRTDTVVGTAPVTKPGKSKEAKKEAFDKSVHDMGMKLGPMQLQDDDDQSSKSVTTVVDAEKAELAEIWDAALCRNQDIQFVVQKLMPSKDPKHTTAVMMKMLSTAMYGAMAASGMAMSAVGPNAGIYMAQNAGASLVMSVLNTAQSKAAKKAAVTETEAIMLYNMIRGVANQVVDNYHNYKKNLGSVNRAWIDYQDLQGMVTEARSGQDSAKQIECEYLLRKARRDIDALNEDVRRTRQALVDLSGPEAADRLDKQIAIETGRTDEIPSALSKAAGGADEAIAADSDKPAVNAKPADFEPDKQIAEPAGSHL